MEYTKMSTEVIRTYSHGFVLGEQEVRRLVQSVHEHSLKIHQSNSFHQNYVAVLRDGSKIRSVNVDEILSLENGGAKQITRVELHAAATSAEKPIWRIDIEFDSAGENAKKKFPIRMCIEGESRDWAFVAAADIEERIKRAKAIAWDTLLTSSRISLVMLIVMMTLAFVTFTTKDPSGRAYAALKAKIDSGEVKDALQGLLVVEEAKNIGTGFIAWMFIPMLLLPGFVLISPAIEWFCPSYNFLWGDYTANYNRKKQRRAVIWTVIALGLVVSLVANYLSKKFGW